MPPTETQQTQPVAPTIGEGVTVGAPQQPAVPSQVAPFLQDTQEVKFAQEEAAQNQFFEGGKTPAEIEADVRSKLEGSTQIPTAPNFEESFTNLREELGLSDIESNITELKRSRRGIEAVTRQRTRFEEGRQVGLGVIAGRISETERQAREDLEFVDRQISYQTEQVQAGYNTINTMMSMRNMDFQAGLEVYNAEFNKNKTIYSAIRSEITEERSFQQRIIERAQDNAKANLATYSNLILKGNMKYKNLSSAQKLDINKMEIQSGLGIGYLSKLKMSLQDKIISSTQRVAPGGIQYVDTVIRQDNGKLRVKSIRVGRVHMSSSGGSAAATAAARNKAAKAAAKAAQQKAFWDTADQSKDLLREGNQWGEVWNTFKAKFPGATAGDIDKALGVPNTWIQKNNAGATKGNFPGYKWWAGNN